MDKVVELLECSELLCFSSSGLIEFTLFSSGEVYPRKVWTCQQYFTNRNNSNIIASKTDRNNVTSEVNILQTKN